MTSPYHSSTTTLADPTLLGPTAERQRSRYAAQRYADLTAVAALRPSWRDRLGAALVRLADRVSTTPAPARTWPARPQVAAQRGVR